MAESQPSNESYIPAAVTADAASNEEYVQALQAAAERQAAAQQNLEDAMRTAAAVPADQLTVRKKARTEQIIPVYPKADRWGALALSGRPFSGNLWPKDHRELRKAKKAYDAFRQLGVVQATLTQAESGVYQIDKVTGRSPRIPHEDTGDTQPVFLRLDDSVRRTEKQYSSVLSRREKLIEQLEPHPPSVKNIYDQTGKNDLLGLSWEESVDGQIVKRSIKSKDDEGRYVVETIDVRGEVPLTLQSEQEFETYLVNNYPSLSKFALTTPAT